MKTKIRLRKCKFTIDIISVVGMPRSLFYMKSALGNATNIYDHTPYQNCLHDLRSIGSYGFVSEGLSDEVYWLLSIELFPKLKEKRNENSNTKKN